MYRVLALYGTPTNPDQFRQYYESTHIPLAQQLPGLTGLRWSFEVQGLMGTSPYFCIAELDFESADAVHAALGTPEGQAVVADVPNYATGGVEIVYYAVPEA